MKKDWTYKKLGEVCDINYGTRVVQKKDGGSIYPVYGGGGATFRMDTYNREDCLVVARFAMSPKCTRIVKGKFFLNDSGLTLDAHEELYQDYLNWHIISLNDEIYQTAKGAAQKNLDVKAFTSLKIAIPPLSIQRSIVAELDLLHSVISKKKEQLRELDDLAQSLFYQMFGAPITNPMGWEIKKLGEVAPVKSYQGDIVSEKGLYWLLNLDMVEAQTGKILEKNMLDKDEIGNSTTSFSPDNVLYSKLRPYLNKVVLPDTCGYCTTELLPLLPQKDILNREYLCYLLRSKSFVDYINTKVAGAKMPRVTMDDFRNFPIPLPPLSLQQSFAAKVSAIEAQKQAITLSIKETEALLAQRMDTYFS